MEQVTQQGWDLSLADWEDVFERSHLGMALVVHGRFVRVNEALCDLLGRRSEEIVGRDAFELADSLLMASEIDGATAAYHEGHRRLHLAGPVLGQGGEERWVSIDAVLIGSEEGGGDITAVATVTDLTDLHRARQGLAASERRSRSLLTNISDTVWVSDVTGKILQTSGSHHGKLGYDEDYWADANPFDLIHPDDLPGALASWNEGIDHPGVEVTREVRMRAADGTWHDMVITGVNLLDDPDVGGAVVTTQNITELRRVERLASTQSAVLELIARGTSLAAIAEACVDFVESNGIDGATSVYLLDGDRLERGGGRAPAALDEWLRQPIRNAERSLCDASMASGRAVVASDLAHSDMDPGLRALAEAEGLQAGWSQPILSISDGVAVGTLCTVYRQPHEPTEHEHHVADVACSLMAIAVERMSNEDRLAHQALHDGLTGLPNRTLLVDRLEHALARRERTGSQIAVLFCDIDRFKVVNDSLGHGVGDQLLVAFAARFRSAVDPSDTVARFGGDEFVVLVEDVADADQPVQLAGRLGQALEAPFVLDGGREVFLTASIGLAHAGDHPTSDAWLRDADAAMYRAKERGRNRLVMFDTEMRASAMARLRVENDLRRSVSRDELVVHLQPIVDLASGRITGAEALARWRHPDQGLLPPAEFIAVAEDTGMIESIGRRILDLAVEAAAGLPVPAGRPQFQLCVNVSARQLSKPGLDEVVVDVCRRHRWDPSSLTLEITESTLVERVDGPADLLARIHDLGVQLAIDDFGTGYSSLARLGHMPVGQVKIDQSLVAAIGQPNDPLVGLVGAAVAIASALGMRTTAEGVEEQVQLDRVRALGCDEAQGFLFAPPLPVEDFADLLATDPRW